MRQIYGAQAMWEAISEEMARDDNVIVIGEDVGLSGGVAGQTTGMLAQYGADRVIDAPIAEAEQVSFAVGAALMGQHVLVDIMIGNSIAYSYDSVVHQAAMRRYMSGGQWEMPLVIKLPVGTANMVGAHHSSTIEGWFQNCPGIKIYAPTFPEDMKGQLKYAIREKDPVIYMHHSKCYAIVGDVPDGECCIEPGKAKIVKEGTDITIVAYQDSLLASIEAAGKLAEENINVEIIDPRTLIPFDKEAVLTSVRKTGRLLVVTEAPKRGGFGNNIVTLVAENASDALKAPICYLGGKNYPIPGGPTEKIMVPRAEDIIEAVHKVIG